MDLQAQLKDGVYAKDRPSDHIIGMVLWALQVDLLGNEWQHSEAMLFQVPFWNYNKKKNETRFRGMAGQVGRPFLGPDNLAVTLRDRTLRGSNINLQASNLTPAQVIAYPQYKKWLSKNLSAGRNEDSDTYVRTSNRNSKKECDEWVNSRPHQHGPLSTRPT
jgi:hypothetical protein